MSRLIKFLWIEQRKHQMRRSWGPANENLGESARRLSLDCVANMIGNRLNFCRRNIAAAVIYMPFKRASFVACVCVQMFTLSAIRAAGTECPTA